MIAVPPVGISVKLKAKLAQTREETESANFHHMGVITSEAGAFAWRSLHTSS